jgi:hypothetical protein
MTDNMPKVELKGLLPLVLVKTPTQKLYDRLMKIYEVGGWVGEDGSLPTEKLALVGPTTHVLATNYFDITDSPEDYMRTDKITVNEFCKRENIDELKQGEINKWFRYNKSSRLSLGQRLI